MAVNDPHNDRRSEKLSRLISSRPPFIIEWGTVLVLLFFVILLIGLVSFTDIL